MTKTKLEKIVKLVTVLATVVLVAVTVLAVALYAKAGVLANKNAKLDNQIKNLSITQSTLEKGVEKRNDEAYLEQQARENLGMIKDNETVYIFD